MSDLASLLERLRGPHRQSERGNFAEVHPDCLTEAADRISTLERELEEAREQWGLATLALDSMHQNRDTVQRHLDACTIRAEAAEANSARMGEALRIAEAVLRNADRFETTDGGKIPTHSPYSAAALARSALQSEKDREGGE
jgi:hypothetical protein